MRGVSNECAHVRRRFVESARKTRVPHTGELLCQTSFVVVVMMGTLREQQRGSSSDCGGVVHQVTTAGSQEDQLGVTGVGVTPTAGGCDLLSDSVKMSSISCVMSSSRVLELARGFNNALLSLGVRRSLGDVVEVWLGASRVGFMRRNVVDKIVGSSSSGGRSVFETTSCTTNKGGAAGGQLRVVFSGWVESLDVAGRSVVVEEMLLRLKEEDDDLFSTLRGWRGERFEVKGGCGGVLVEVERSATCIFGMRQFGVDINGFVRHPEKGLCLWVQKRARDKQTWPGKMDNMVGGGLSVGYSVIETALKEASEEAGIPASLLQVVSDGGGGGGSGGVGGVGLIPCGTVSFFFESERGLFPNTEYVFDLELPPDFVPVNMDGEVEGFNLITAKEALELVLSPEFKTTSCPVTLDFLVRHGVINPMNESGYGLLMEYLHVPLWSIFNDHHAPHHLNRNNK